jgi:rRNA maturation protein Nop10
MSKNAPLFALCALMALSSTAFAGPTGSFSFDFGLPGKPVWDISGTYTLSPSVGGSTSVEFPITITQDSQGMLTGSGNTTVEIDGVPATGTYTVKGKVTNSGGVAKVNATVKLSGAGTIQGFDTTYSLSASYKLEIDPVSRTVVGSAKGSAKASGVGSGPVSEDISAPLPLDMVGSWKLLLTDLLTTGNKLTGTSSVVLGNNRTLSLGVKGSYSAKNTKSTISLSGIDASKGTTLKIMGTNDTLVNITVKGKILGQVVQ